MHSFSQCLAIISQRSQPSLCPTKRIPSTLWVWCRVAVCQTTWAIVSTAERQANCFTMSRGSERLTEAHRRVHPFDPKPLSPRSDRRVFGTFAFAAGLLTQSLGLLAGTRKTPAPSVSLLRLRITVLSVSREEPPRFSARSRGFAPLSLQHRLCGTGDSDNWKNAAECCRS